MAGNIQEDRKNLSNKTQDMKRATDSLMEELEAIDYYRQRAEACSDSNLKKVLIHNMQDEKEHAAMLLEWIQQNDEKLSKEMKEYLFSNKKDIAGMEKPH